jgi:pteridine reductase
MSFRWLSAAERRFSVYLSPFLVRHRVPVVPATPIPLSAGDVAIVTGGAKRLGRGISLALAKRLSLDVVVHYGRSKSAAQQLVDELKTIGCNSTCVAADLREPATAATAIFNTAKTLGPVRVLINCAAVFEERALDSIDTDHWHQHLTVNALAPLMLSQQFTAQLPSGQTGHILNIVDWRATRPPGTHAVYTASKAALCSLTKTLAQQLAPAIQVNAIAPGAMLPPTGAEDWHAQRAAEGIPLKRPGSPSDICDAVVYLLQSRFITGEILHVSGGEQL